jgi:hypothetical protein
VGGRKLGRNFLSIFLGKLWKDFSCEFFGPFLWGFNTLFDLTRAKSNTQKTE